jgi:adenylate cyclase
MNPGRPDERVFPLSVGTVTIGRTKDNAIFCLHKSLSRKHAQLQFDGVRLRITDLQSKNGVFVKGRRVGECELIEGDSFRCGDITFLLEGATTRADMSHEMDRTAQTLPSPFALPPKARRGGFTPSASVESPDEPRYKDRLFLLIRASELCVSELRIDNILDELVALAVQGVELDRIALLALDESTLEMRPRVLKSFVRTEEPPYSTRVVDWVVDRGMPACFADVSRDGALPGDASIDRAVRGAICVPINPGGGIIGVIYADSISRADGFRPDDLALLRALANLAAIAIENAALRSANARAPGPTTSRR